jgi:Fat storage-inducing transmembrane protein
MKPTEQDEPKDNIRSLLPGKLDPARVVLLTLYPVTVLLGVIANYPPESYYSQKHNIVNLLFLKFAWGWTTLVFTLHVSRMKDKIAPLARYLVATGWWCLVTQWCFGPPIMDKVPRPEGEKLTKIFSGTGGICNIHMGEPLGVFTSALCRSRGGAWRGGHDLVRWNGMSLLTGRVDIFLYLRMPRCFYGGSCCRM